MDARCASAMAPIQVLLQTARLVYFFSFTSAFAEDLAGQGNMPIVSTLVRLGDSRLSRSSVLMPALRKGRMSSRPMVVIKLL